MTQAELEREERQVETEGGRSVPNAQGIRSMVAANVYAIIEVDPEDLLVDPDLKALRGWTGSSKHELSIPSLAQMIYEEGQDSPCLVRPTEDGLMIVAGHRRQEAALLIRKDLDPEWQLKVIVEELTQDQALRKAISENVQREDFTRVERGRIAQLIRKRFGWVGKEGTKKVAEFVGLSPATVAQDEKLLGADKDILDKVLSDRMTVTAALDLMVGKVEKQPEVAARAQEIAAEKAAKKEKKNVAKAKPNPEPTPEVSSVDPHDITQALNAVAMAHLEEEKAAESVKPTPPPPAPKVESSHIRQAQREVAGALDKPRSMKMTEAIGLMEQWTGPGYPRVMTAFAGAFVDRSHGKLKGGDKELEARWDDIGDALSGKKPRKAIAPVVKPVAKPAKKAVAKKVAGKPVKKVVVKTAVKAKAKVKAKTAAKKAPATKAAKVKAKPQTEKLVGVPAAATAK